MIQAVHRAVALLGLTLADALTMASRTPAAFLDLEAELGAIAPGYRADLVAFNSNFDVINTWVGGRGLGGQRGGPTSAKLHMGVALGRSLECSSHDFTASRL